jgi:hypothetical protein
MDSVRAVATFDAAKHEAGEIASLEDLKASVEEFGGSALPALLEELNSYGCMSTNSAAVIDLVQIIGEQEQFDNQIRTVLSETLVNVAVAALDTAGSDGESGMQMAEDTAGDNKPDMQAVEVGQQPRFDCAERAFDLVQGWAASTQSDLETILEKTQLAITDLNDADPAAIELVDLLSELAPEDDEWAKIFELMSSDSGLHKDAQGAACEAAVERGSELSTLREDLAAVTSPQVSVCVVESSVDWEDTEYATWGLKNNDESVRLAALATFNEIGGTDDIQGLLVHLFSVPDPNGVSASESERNKTLAVLADLVKESDMGAGELLANASDLANKLGPDGADWLAQLDQAIPDWDQVAEDKD